MSKFTPGPWKVEQTNEELNGQIPFVLLGRDDRREWKGMDIEICGLNTTSANANLIAAAPEMFEALEYALADLKFFNGRTSLIEAALKKARGES